MAYTLCSFKDFVATFQFNDPARRNALSEAMLAELLSAFDRLPDTVRAVVLRAGANDKVWCAGFDIGALEPGRDPLAPDDLLAALFRRVRECSAPVIGMMHGSAWGGGTDLALRCDILIGDPTASLAFTPAKLGLPYDEDGLRNAIGRAGPALALEMFATADPVGAERAHRAGLLNHLVPEAELELFTYALAGRIATNAPLVVASAKQHVQTLAHVAVGAAEREVLEIGRRRALDSADYREGLAAFREKRAPRFMGR